MLKNALNPGLLREILANSLSKALRAESPIRVTELTVPHSSGMSCETVLLDAVEHVDGAERTRSFVVRVAPRGEGIFWHYDLDREGKIMSALRRREVVPAPAVVAYEPDAGLLGAPFLIVERRYGMVASDDPPFTLEGWVLDLTDTQRATMYENALRVLVNVGLVDPSATDLGWLSRSGDTSRALDDEISWWTDFFHRAAQGRSFPTLETTLEWLREHQPSRSDRLALSWGDARFGNLMFDEEQAISAVLDWEMATLGPPELDLGFFLFTNRAFTAGMGAPLPGGFLDRDRTIARYEELAGRAAEDMTFHEAFAGFRVATLMMRVGLLLIEMGLMPADASMPETNPGSLSLAALLDVPPPNGGRGWISGRG